MNLQDIPDIGTGQEGKNRFLQYKECRLLGLNLTVSQKKSQRHREDTKKIRMSWSNYLMDRSDTKTARD